MEHDSDCSVDFSQRNPHANVDEIFYTRWSPRSFKKVEIAEHIYESIFDAARWSPSCFNAQPWRFITATNEPFFSRFLLLLSEKNQLWAKNASLIGFIFSKNEFDHAARKNNMAAFDSGAAWMAMTLQTRKFGLYTHAMAGIDRSACYTVLDIDENESTIQCGFVIGAIDSPEKLADDFKNKEIPSPRKPLHDIWFKDTYKV